jgi:hypothetical protein
MTALRSRELPWDSQRGARVWASKPAAERAALLAQNERLLLAAQGLQIQADGQAVRVATWREIGGRR